MLARRIIAVTILVALLIAIAYFCIYSFTMSLEQLGVFKTYAEKSEVLSALIHLIASALYLLLAMIILLFIGILVYMAIVMLYKL
jgi:hypothetical protein